MSSNWPTNRPGVDNKVSNPFPNAPNPVQHSPFPNTPLNPSHLDPNQPLLPGGYGHGSHQHVSGQFPPPGPGYSPPPMPPTPGVVNRAGVASSPFQNPPSVHMTASLDFNSQVPPAFAEPPPMPPPTMDELGQPQTTAGPFSQAKAAPKTLGAQMFHENLAPTAETALKPDDETLDSVVLMNTTQNFVSLSVGTVPATEQMVQKTNVTLSYTITPLSPGEDVPLINYGNESITRCKQCRAYINPFVRHDPSKRFWVCNLCETSNELNQKFGLMDSQYSGDTKNEMEMKYAVVEYVASSDYTVRPPQPPCFLFLIDVSSTAVNSRMVEVVCKAITDLILETRFTVDERTLMGVMTFDTSVHFYQISRGFENFQLLVVSDLEDLFLPIPGDVLLNLNESATELLKLLEMLPSMWKNTSTRGSALGSAIRSAQYSMKHVGGRLLVFTCSPCLEGDFSYSSEDKAAQTSSMSTVLTMAKKPVIKMQPMEKCKEFSMMMAQTQTSLDLFVCTPQAINLPKIQYMANLTSGNIYYYPFKNHSDNSQLVNELKHVVNRNTVWESVMRIRLSKGWKITNWFGNCSIRGSDLMVLPTTTEDHSYTVTFVPDSSSVAAGLTSGSSRKVLYMQTALLHTSSCGERRIRVFNTAVKVTNDQVTMLESINVEPLVYTMLLGALKVYDTSGEITQARSYLTTHCTRVANSLYDIGSMTESMQVMVMYVLGLLKSVLFTDSQNQEYRVYLSTKLRGNRLDQAIMYAYPQLYDLTMELNLPEPVFQGLPLTCESLKQEGAYLLFNGQYMLIWVGKNVPNNFLQSTFDVPSFEHLNVELVPHALEQMNSPNAHKLKVVMEALRARVPPHVPLLVMKQGEGDAHFYANLIQDKTQGMMITYQDFLATMKPGAPSLTR